MGKLDNYVCDGQMDIFNFLQIESEEPTREQAVEIEKLDYWKKPLMDRVHPRVKHLFTQMMKGPKSDTHRYILQCYAYNNTLERMTEVCQTTYGTGSFTTDKGVVSYDSKGWIYKYNEPWEGVYQEQYTWREFARKIIELIEAKVYVDDFEPMCEHSLHTCNAKELWKVADSLETECPHTCCRSCKVRMCGARCNGSEEPTPVIEDIKNIPKQCCGVTPWLRKSRCCRWNEENPQMYLMYYICPKCGKTVVDETGWVKNRHGTYEEASQKALEDWNNPETVFEIKEFNDPKNGNYVMCSLDEREEFEKLYGISYEDYKRPLIETANEIYRKKEIDSSKLSSQIIKIGG
ncbi:MAG: hypothetical protein IKW81_06265 [Pseudobutyrivibrio sp.]|nr:hypothetical protein [Pseudobutyrivibrio sp.]